MPRSGWKKPISDRRLADLVSVAVLTRVFPPDLVDEVIAQAGRTERRNRALPARMMAYFAMGMGLFSEGSYEDVLAQLADGLSWASGWQVSFSQPSKSAIFQARSRLGSEPMAALFARVATPLGTAKTAGVWLAGRRLVAIDSCCLDVADTAQNLAFFGRPAATRGEKPALPQARLVALAECGTHAIFDAAVGASTSPQATLAVDLIGRLQPGMLLIADRSFCSNALWRGAIGAGADVVCRARTDLRLEHLQTLEDNSWLARIRPGADQRADQEAEPITVRAISHSDKEGRGNTAPDPLLTTIVDLAQASATELTEAYVKRWKVALAFDELQTHQRGQRTVLRSKSPELVLQEIWGQLCCHYAIRSLMTRPANPAALSLGLDVQPATAHRCDPGDEAEVGGQQ